MYSLFQQKLYTKHNSWSWKSAGTVQTSSNFEKNNQNINPRSILGKVIKFQEIWMSY